VKTIHCRHGREYRLLEVPRFSVDGYFLETRLVYQFFACYFHGHTCQLFRDVTTLTGDTLAERYEHRMSRLEQIRRAGYLIMVQWECELEDAGRPELLAHPTVQHSLLCTRDALYGGRTEAMRPHYKARENETIQYVEFMSLYS